jgi:F-type H+-transporting ATPase subunit epsilon
MPTPFKVQILTAEKVARDTEVIALRAPGTEGSFGVLAHHAPLITALLPGRLILTMTDGEREVYAVSGGFLEVSDNRAVVLADALERPESIDVDRAEAARERARRRLLAREAGLDVPRAEAALVRALNRLRIARRYGSMLST